MIYPLPPIQISKEMNDIQSGLIQLGVCCLRRVYSLTCCRRGESMKITRSLRFPPYKLEEGGAIPTPFIAETWDNGDSQRTWIQHSGQIVGHDDPFMVRGRAPWMWIGYELPSGVTIDLTLEIKEFVLPGNTITPELIHSYFPKSRYGTLKYIDQESFVMMDLSSKGVVIEDAPTQRDIRFGRGVCSTPVCSGT